MTKHWTATLSRTEIRHELDSVLCKCGCYLKRIGEDVAEKLDCQPGTLVCDDYQGYNALIKDNQFTEAGCMEHAQRKFFELFAANKSHIAQAAPAQFNAKKVFSALGARLVA